MYSGSVTVDYPKVQHWHLTGAMITETYNKILEENECYPVSEKTLKRHCIAPHKSQTDSTNYCEEASVKFGKAASVGTSPLPINIQYARSFVKMELAVLYKFSDNRSFIRCFSTINSINNKNPVFLSTKNLFRAVGSWINVVTDELQWRPAIRNKGDSPNHCPLQNKNSKRYHG